MSVAFDVDNEVTARPPLSFVQVDDPFSKLFFDRTTAGFRLMAIAEPVDRKPQGYLTAAIAIAAFEEALAVAVSDGAEAGLNRAFLAANDAVRSANKRTMASQRSFAGITAFVIQGKTATIGFVPPGQALLVQDGRLYGVPDLGSWSAGFMPEKEQDPAVPLGFTAQVRPHIRKTNLGVNDQFVLGASAVGRVLANREAAPVADGDHDTVIDRLEAALADSGIDDAYAAWIRCDPAPESTISPARMAEIERTWRGENKQTTRPIAVKERFHDPRMRRAVALDHFHGRLIETSERFFARKTPETLPFDSPRRFLTPLGASSLKRYVAPRMFHIAPRVLSLMPRGLKLSRRNVIGIVVALCLAGVLALTHNVALGRDSNVDQLLGVVRTEIQLSRTSESAGEANEHLAIAQRMLNRAASKGTAEQLVAISRSEIALVSDQVNGVGRLKRISRVGSLPEHLKDIESHLMFADGRLFLIANGVYEVGADGRELVQVLAVGDTVQSSEVLPIVAAAVDSGELLVSDGKSLFRLVDGKIWSATDLAELLPRSDTPNSIIAASNGNVYLLDAATSQVKKYAANDLSAAPVLWLKAEASSKVDHPVDMAVDSKVYLVSESGTIQTFSRGVWKSEKLVIEIDENSHVVGLSRGSSSGDLYIVAIDNGDGTLIRYNPNEQTSEAFFSPAVVSVDFEPQAEQAFAETIDFTVDEKSGTLYFLTANGIWSASLS